MKFGHHRKIMQNHDAGNRRKFFGLVWYGYSFVAYSLSKVYFKSSSASVTKIFEIVNQGNF